MQQERYGFLVMFKTIFKSDKIVMRSKLQQVNMK